MSGRHEGVRGRVGGVTSHFPAAAVDAAGAHCPRHHRAAVRRSLRALYSLPPALPARLHS